jgi:HEPN domain-containing protein
MLDRADMIEIARARLCDAQALFAADRFDGAIYLCGYAAEIALKARICKTLAWAGYPETRGEFNKYRTFKTHDLDVLLHLSGIEEIIKGGLFVEWSTVVTWDPESRYKPTGSGNKDDARWMIESTDILVETLWK